MIFPVKYGTATTIYTALFYLNTRNADDNPTLATGDVKISKDGGAFANLATLPDAQPALGRQVRIQISETEAQCKIGFIEFIDQTATAEWDQQHVMFYTYGHPSAFDTSKFDCIRTSTAQAGAAGSITLDASASATNDLYIGCSLQIISGTGVGQARTIILYVGSSKIAYVDRVWATNPDNTSVFVILPGKLTADIVNTGLAQAGAATTITLATTAIATNDYYDGGIVQIISGTGLGQSRVIKSYVGSTRVATVADSWATTPDNTSVYIVRGLGDVEVGVISDGLISDSTFAADAYPRALRKNTAQAGAAGSITLDSSASATNDLYVGCSIKITSGTGAGQSRTIILYVGSSKIAYVDRVWATNPANDSVFVINSGKLTADVVNAGLAQAGAANTITLASTAVATNNYYNTSLVTIISGTGVGQSRQIYSYVGSTRVATIKTAWAVNPDNTSVYIVRGFGNVDANIELMKNSSQPATNMTALANETYPGAVDTAAGAPTTTTFGTSTATLVKTDADYWKDRAILFTSGVLEGQAKLINSCSKSTTYELFTTDAFTSAPGNGDTFEII